MIDFNFGTLYIYEKNTCVIEIKEIDSVTGEQVQKVVDSCKEKVSGDFGLISNRVNPYSINPMELYQILSSCERLKCAAVVSYRESTKRLFPVEKIIEKDSSERLLPLEMFESLDLAIEWIQSSL